MNIRTGILNVVDLHQKWIISETKRHTYIMIIDDKGKIIGWSKNEYMAWWLNDNGEVLFK